MELGDALLALVAPLQPGDLLAGARLSHASTELGLRLTFVRDEGHVHVEVFPAPVPPAPEPPQAARSARLRFAYRLGRGHGTLGDGVGKTLCEAVARLAGANEDRVLDQLASESSQRIREVRGGRLLQRAGGADAPHFTLSPYVGCLIGCRFCYAQDRVGLARRFRGAEPARWGSYVDARMDAPERLREELAQADTESDAGSGALPIKLCPIVSDPYHAIEARLELTRGCLEVLRDAPPRLVMVLTRARLIERDADLLAAMPGAMAGFSIPTVDDTIRRHFEPRAAAIDERFEVLAGFRRQAIRTFAIVQPMLPGSLDALADHLAETVSSVSLDILRGEGDATALFDAYPEARDAAWQQDRLLALTEALTTRGVAIWNAELPPG